MTPGVECELKLALADAADYEAVRQGLGPPTAELHQQNLFLDTAESALAGRRWALRVRRETGAGSARVLVTLKGPSTRMGSALRRAEQEAEAPEALWQRVLEGPVPAGALPEPIRALLKAEGPLDAPLQRVLSFTNDRTTYRLRLADAQRLLELDRTRFATGEVDHELELELTPTAGATEAELRLEVAAVERALGALLGGLGVRTTPSRSGKYSRARAYAGRP